MTKQRYDLVVIGGGPGGYGAAIHAGRRGLRTALVEAGAVGGACLHWGCVPTKTLLESAGRLLQVREAATLGIDGVDAASVSFNWSQALVNVRRLVERQQRGVALLLRQAQVEVITGHARPRADGAVVIARSGGGRRTLRAAHLALATGSLAGRTDLAPLGERAMDMQGFLALDALPPAAAVWGSGPEAVEMALFLALVGVRSALVCDSQRLLPALDGDLGAFARRRLGRAGVSLHLGRRPLAVDRQAIVLDDGRRVPAAFVLNLGPRLAVLDALDALELARAGGFVKVDLHGATSRPGVYAVGDVTGRSMLAHGASAQAAAAVAHLTGRPAPADLAQVPTNISLLPELASVGASEEELRRQGVDYDRRMLPVAANAKVQIEGSAEGFVKVLSDRRYGEVLGVHVAAPRATELIAEAALAMRFSLTALEVAHTIHPHPSVSEAIMEAHRSTDS